MRSLWRKPSNSVSSKAGGLSSTTMHRVQENTVWEDLCLWSLSGKTSDPRNFLFWNFLELFRINGDRLSQQIKYVYYQLWEARYLSNHLQAFSTSGSRLHVRPHEEVHMWFLPHITYSLTGESGLTQETMIKPPMFQHG